MKNLLLSPGSLFGNRFEILRPAGSGGMGTVYRAIDRYSGEPVALKLVHAGPAGPDDAERFAREAQLLSELRHPGIVAYVAHGQTPNGQRFLAMEWLEGENLGERLARGMLPVRDCLRLLDQVTDALSVAHQRGIIHRDLKPTNLFLVGGNVSCVKILDFGIARRIAASQAMTKTGMVVGTPEYMAPEQARGARELTPAADLFSLGCVLYECLSGQAPFVADHLAAVLVRILFEEPIPIEECCPGVPAALSAILGRLLAKDPAQRVADAAALRAELMRLGDLPEPPIAATMVAAKPKTESFADQEQGLFSIVLAAPAEPEIGLDATPPGRTVPLATTERQALQQALMALGCSPDYLASGTLVVTVPSLGSAQDQATLAARTALLIKERWPESVVSMATGRGAVHGRTAVGEVVELAARALKSGSHPAFGKLTTGVMIDPLSAKLIEGRFAQTPQPGGTLLLHEERDADESRPLLGKPTPCVGRDAELGTLESQFAACIEESEARVMLFAAPPGTGKSRLRHEFVRRVEKRSDPVTVLLGRGDMMSAGTPYGMLRAAIHRLCGVSGSEPLATQRERLRARVAQHLTAVDAERVVWFVGELCSVPFPEEGKPMLQAARQDPKIMRDCLRRAFMDFLAAECAAAPVLLVLDDLQWSDELTVSVLDEALRAQAGARLFVLVFARPEVHEVFPKLWPSHRVQEILLKGLSKKACERLIVQVLGKDVPAHAVARAVEHSAGNALLLEELIRSIAEGKPEAQSETVVAMLQARLGRLDANLRRAVRAASVFGQTFWRGGVAALLGLESTAPDVESWLSGLVDAELVEPHAQSRLANQAEYGFRHALVRDAAYNLLADSDLQTGHRLAGDFLEAAQESNATVIAEHFERGGDKPRAAGYYLRAAAANNQSGNYLGSLHFVERALSCRPEEAICAELRSIECWAALIVERFDRIAPAAEYALARLRPGSLGWCRVVVGALVVMSIQNMTRALALISQTLAIEPEEDARSAYIEALLSICRIATISAPWTLLQAIVNKMAASTAQAEANNPLIRRYLHTARGAVALMREHRPWTTVLEAQRACAIAREASDPFIELPARVVILEWAWIDLGDLEGARRRLLEIESDVAQSQSAMILGQWRQILARVLCELPDASGWVQAEALVSPFLTSPGGHPMWTILTRSILARVALCRGQLAQAEELTRTAMQSFPAAASWQLHAAGVQIQALVGLGRPSEATAVAETVLAVMPELGGTGFTEVEVRVAASTAFYAAGNRERAHAELRETLRQIKLRADDIIDPSWKNSYLTRNPYCVRAQGLAREWGLDMDIAVTRPS